LQIADFKFTRYKLRFTIWGENEKCKIENVKRQSRGFGCHPCLDLEPVPPKAESPELGYTYSTLQPTIN
jgi:hypothetical protein